MCWFLCRSLSLSLFFPSTFRIRFLLLCALFSCCAVCFQLVAFVAIVAYHTGLRMRLKWQQGSKTNTKGKRGGRESERERNRIVCGCFLEMRA